MGTTYRPAVMVEVFADRMQVTIDRMGYRAMRDKLLPLLNSLGCSVGYDSPGEEAGLWTEPEGGTFKVAKHHAVAALGASGRFLAKLRTAQLLGEFLHLLGEDPHKVTVLDATMDVQQDAVPVVHALFKRATTGEGVRLTRKRVPLTGVTRLMGLRADGRESGTVWVGLRGADIRLKAYDKQLERAAKGVDIGPCMRYELSIKSGAITLADVFDPTRVFWNYMQHLLPRPVGLSDWLPGAMGFTLPRKPVLSVLEQLRARLTYSTDIASLVRLVDQLPDGRAVLLRELAWVYPDKPLG